MHNQNKKVVVCLIDGENVHLAKVESGLIVDYKALRNILKTFGEVMFAFIFFPDTYDFYNLPPDLNILGYTIVICQKLKGRERDKDVVDMILNMTGIKFCQFNEITDLVIVSNDADMVHLVGQADFQRKKVHVIGTDKISSVYKRAVDMKDIHDLPLKEI